MKKIKRWRYYCDYCKKVGGSAYHMAKHEKHCTLNPNRECGMCQIEECDQPKISVLLECLPEPKPYEIIDEYGYVCYPGFDKATELAMPELRRLTGGCPACILSALRQKGIPVPMVESFNYKNESENWLSALNDLNYSL